VAALLWTYFLNSTKMIPYMRRDPGLERIILRVAES